MLSPPGVLGRCPASALAGPREVLAATLPGAARRTRTLRLPLTSLLGGSRELPAGNWPTSLRALGGHAERR